MTYKFRAWDGRQMQNGFNISAYNGDIFSVSGYEKDWPLMMFIGLQDKNKKDIYAGDILECVNEDGEKVISICEYGIHRRQMASGLWVDIPGFSFVIKSANFHSFPIVKNYLGIHDLEILEVIGNIYQNPEFIK